MGISITLGDCDVVPGDKWGEGDGRGGIGGASWGCGEVSDWGDSVTSVSVAGVRKLLVTKFSGRLPLKELLVRCGETGFGVVLVEFL